MSSETPKATLYYFNGSIWSATAELCALEKRFDEKVLNKVSVNLMAGQNFSPEFLKINTKGTIPTLVVPYESTVSTEGTTRFKSLTSTIEICQFLNDCTLGQTSSTSVPSPSLSPATVQGTSDSEFLINLVHSETAPNPNHLFMSFRNEAERKLKWESGASLYLKGRQKALLKYQKESEVEEDPRLNKFYALKIQENDHMISILDGTADATEYMKHSSGQWVALGKTLQILESKLKSTYLIGDQISLADLHVGAFLVRTLAASGAKGLDIPEGVKALNAQHTDGAVVGPKVIALLEAYFERESFKTVYKTRFH